MKLKNLLNFLERSKVYGSTNLPVSSLVDDSRKVKRGSLFVAIPGLRVDAYKFIGDAIKKGATAIVAQKPPQTPWLDKVTYIKVPDSRRALGLFASAWYGNPAKNLKVIGVTGTKGKTTVAESLYQVLLSAGKKVGLVSSISAKIGKKSYDTGLHVTNPEPLILQQFLQSMVKEGCEYAIIEVTSHGIDQQRIAGVDFDIAILTNIAHEHLDYHKTFANYQATKRKLFEKAEISILNEDDKSFENFKRNLKGKSEIVTYAFHKKANYQIVTLNTKEKSSFVIENVKKQKQFESPLLGNYNISNLAAAIACARVLKISWPKIQTAIAKVKPPKGRLEKIENKKGIEIYIDFAHTPNSLESVLSFLKTKTKGKLISVFGCAGERDTKKRSMMGKISSQIADISIFTAEDPRSEDVDKIIGQIAKGAQKTGAKEVSTKISAHAKKHLFLKIPERGEAITHAIHALAKGKDVVVICGKGHEKSMAYNGVEYPWSDHEAVKLAISGKTKKMARDVKKLNNIHFTGIKGVGMTSLALCAQDLGIKVTGSDVQEVFVTDEVLAKRKIKWGKGFGTKNVRNLPDLVITTGAHGGLKNPEVAAAKKKGVNTITLSEAQAKFAEGKDTIAVCGVGGKTTTSSLIATLLQNAHLNPSYAIGVGSIDPLGVPGVYNKEGKHFILEADEFAISPGVDNRPRFSFLDPKIVVVTNIEHDHPDIYPSIKETKTVFKKFFHKIPSDGLLVACVDNNNVAEVIANMKVNILTYGFNPLADYHINKISFEKGSTFFDLAIKNQKKVIKNIKLKVPGRFNVQNATAAFVVGDWLKINKKSLLTALKKFGGTRRRFEKMLEKNGKVFYDDYAHHPQEIKSTLVAAREWFPDSRLVAIFQPHTYSRTKSLFTDFAKAFDHADVVAFMDIYASARESRDPHISSKMLAQETKKYHPQVHYTKGHKETLKWIKQNSKKGDIILTMGAGDIFHLYNYL